VKQVKVAEEVVARYQLGRKIDASVGAAFDARDGTLWVRKPSAGSNMELDQVLFEAIAGRMFVNDAPGYCAPPSGTPSTSRFMMFAQRAKTRPVLLGSPKMRTMTPLLRAAAISRT
jgi:hypothetical protein